MDSLSGTEGAVRKVKGTLHWVDAEIVFLLLRGCSNRFLKRKMTIR